MNDNDKDKEYQKLIERLKEEAIEAKMKLANSNYENDRKNMKLKRQVEKLVTVLGSYGVKVDLK